MSHSVLFIGGALDGQLKAVGRSEGHYVAYKQPMLRLTIAPDFERPERDEYIIANGIGRLSTMDPSEVAVRLASLVRPKTPMRRTVRGITFYAEVDPQSSEAQRVSAWFEDAWHLKLLPTPTRDAMEDAFVSQVKDGK